MTLDPAYDPYDPYDPLAPTQPIDDPNALSGPGVWAPGAPPPWYAADGIPPVSDELAGAPPADRISAGLPPAPAGDARFPWETGEKLFHPVDGTDYVFSPSASAVSNARVAPPPAAPGDEWTGHSFGAQPPVTPAAPLQSPGSPSLAGMMPWDSDIDLASGSGYVSPDQGYQDIVARIRRDGIIDPATGDIRADISDRDAQRYIEDLFKRSPEAAVELQQRLSDIKTTKVLAERQRIENENWQRLQQTDADRKAAARAADAKSAAIEADAQRIANTKIDPTGNLSGGQQIAGFIAAFTGGLLRGQTGNPADSAIPDLLKIINGRVDAQKVDLDNQRAGIATRRSLLADEVARHGDEFRAQEAYRLALLQHASNQLDIEMQNYSPRGTTFARLGAAKAGVVAAQAQSQQALREHLEDRELKVREQARKDAETLSAIAKNKAEAAKLYSDINKDKAEKQTWSPDQLGVLNPGLPKPPIPMTQADYTKWLGTQKQGEEYKTAARANDPNERARELSVPGVVDDQGKPVLFRGKEEAKAFGEAKTRASNMVRKVDDLIKLIEEHGYEPDFAKSEAWQKAQQSYASLLLEAKEMDHLGALSGSDISLEERKIGTSDPTQVRNTIPGLKSFRNDTIEGTNSILHNSVVVPEGRAVKRWEPPPLDTRRAEPTSAQIKTEKLLEPQNQSFDEALGSELRARKFATGAASSTVDIGDPADRALYDRTYADVRATYDPGASLEQQRSISELGVTARGDSPEAKTARETLAKIGEDAKTGKLRELARAALQQAVGPQASPEETATRSSGVSYETVPPKPKGRR